MAKYIFCGEACVAMGMRYMLEMFPPPYPVSARVRLELDQRCLLHTQLSNLDAFDA